MNELLSKKLNVTIYNFVDILSHAKTDVKMIKELTGDEKAYRDLTITWFRNSPLFELLKILSNHNINLVITSDHGTINVTEASKVIGEKSISQILDIRQEEKLSSIVEMYFRLTILNQLCYLHNNLVHLTFLQLPINILYIQIITIIMHTLCKYLSAWRCIT